MPTYPGTMYPAAIDPVNGYGGNAVAVTANRAYVVNSLQGVPAHPTVVAYDISNNVPVVIGASVPDAVNGYRSYAIAVKGNRAYVVNFLGGAEASTYPALVVYDVSGPVPVVIGTAAIDTVNGYRSYAIAVQGNRAYVVNLLSNGGRPPYDPSVYPALVVYDISTDIPVVIGAAAIDAVNGYQSYSVAVEGDRVYVANNLYFNAEVSTYPALVTYDVSGSVPVVIGASVPDGTRTYGFNARSVAVKGNRAYVVNFLTDNYDTPAGPSVDVYPPLVVYDISGSTPVVIGVAAIAPATVYAAWAVAINGTIAYVATFLWNPNAGLYPPLAAYDISADIPVVVGAAAIDPVNGYDGFSVAANDTGTYVMNSLTYGDESLHPALVAYVRPRLSSTIVPSSGGAVSRCQVSHVLPSRLLARDWSAFQRQIEALRPADVEEVRGSRFDFC